MSTSDLRQLLVDEPPQYSARGITLGTVAPTSVPDDSRLHTPWRPEPVLEVEEGNCACPSDYSLAGSDGHVVCRYPGSVPEVPFRFGHIGLF